MTQSSERDRRIAATRRKTKTRAAVLRLHSWWQRRDGRRAAKAKIQRARLKAAGQAERARARARAASQKNRLQAARARTRADRARVRAHVARARTEERGRAHRRRVGAG